MPARGLTTVPGLPGSPTALRIVFAQPAVDFVVSAITLLAVALRELAGQFLGFGAHLFDVIIGQVTPPLADIALHLLPLTSQDVFVHDYCLLSLLDQTRPRLRAGPPTEY